MTLPNIYVFVLALVAFTSVALGWLIYDLRRQVRILDSVRDTTKSTCDKRWQVHVSDVGALRDKLRETSASNPVLLGAQVAELSEAVERLRKTHQRFAGRVSEELWREAAPDNAPPTIDRDALRREHASAIMPAGVRK